MAQVILVRAEQSDLLGKLLRPTVFIRNLIVHRELLWQLIRREVVCRYRGSYLGIFWSILNPMMMLAVFTLVFGAMHQHRWPLAQAGVFSFAINLFAGIVLFQIFSEVASAATTQIVSNPNFVKKAVFPLELLGISLLVASAVHSLLAMGIELLAVWVALGAVPPSAAIVPLLYLPAMLFTLGVCWLLASLGVFFRDLASAIGPAVQLLFFLTPIVYDRSLLQSLGLTGWVLTALNPFVILVDSARGAIIRGVWPDLGELAYVTIYSAAAAVLGYIVFMKLRRYFADAI